MKPRCVHQLLAGYSDGDAISREARVIRDIFRRQGIESDIFVPTATIGIGVAGDCMPLESCKAGAGDALLYHYSTASECSAVFAASPASRSLRYHNITPAEYFRGFDDRHAAELSRARAELAVVVEAASHVTAVSEFNARELRSLGSREVVVVPLLFSLSDFNTAPDPAMSAKLGGPIKNLLFVGRMAPNKRVEDLILAFAWLHRTIDPATRLVLVGSERSCPRYYAMLRMLAGRLGLSHVYLEGFLSEAQLAACYDAADLFVSASLHEGFCLPLIEAMAREVPVIARDVGGMPEALGASGVLFDHAEPRILAELFQSVLTDAGLRGEILDSQKNRLEEFRRRDLAADCLKLLPPLRLSS
jgi:glycosyltransferase involved in cell wall biosynthesis